MHQVFTFHTLSNLILHFFLRLSESVLAHVDVCHVLVALLLDDARDERARLLAHAHQLEVEVPVEVEHDEPDVEADQAGGVDHELVEQAVDEVEADVFL